MIYIYGSGGRAKLIKEILLRLNKKKKDIIFIDDLNKDYQSSDFLIKKFKSLKDQLFIGISSPKIQKLKYLFFKKKLKDIDNKPLIDPTVILKSDVKIGNNVVILENSTIGPNVRINKNVFIGAHTIINHDTHIGEFSTIGHGSNLAGNVKVAEKCTIGISNVIKQNILVEKQVTTGSGANIIKNCKKNLIYIGNPAKKINF